MIDIIAILADGDVKQSELTRVLRWQNRWKERFGRWPAVTVRCAMCGKPCPAYDHQPTDHNPVCSEMCWADMKEHYI